MALKAQSVPAERSMGRLLASRGELAEGIKHATVARDISEQLFRTEPDNTEWMQWGAYARLDLAELQLAAGDAAAAGASTRSGCEAARRLLQRDRSVATWRIPLQLKCLKLRSAIALRAGSRQEALEIAKRATLVARGETRQPDRSFGLASALLQTGDAYQSLAQPKAAQIAWSQARAVWPERAEATPQQLADLSMLELKLGHADMANRIAQRLQAVGYRFPAYLDSLKNGGRP
jgi:tetratricopeptide (TPR) repeat protein